MKFFPSVSLDNIILFLLIFILLCFRLRQLKIFFDTSFSIKYMLLFKSRIFMILGVSLLLTDDSGYLPSNENYGGPILEIEKYHYVSWLGRGLTPIWRWSVCLVCAFVYGAAYLRQYHSFELEIWSSILNFYNYLLDLDVIGVDLNSRPRLYPWFIFLITQFINISLTQS